MSSPPVRFARLPYTPGVVGRSFIRTWLARLALAAVSLAAFAAAAAPVRAPAVPDEPRFASLRAAKTNMRTGPGRRYPIAWVFVRRGLPVQVVGAFETWRQIRDWEGAEGWIHQSLLSDRPSVIVVGGEAALRREPAETAPTVARVAPRAVGRPIDCAEGWCRVEFGGLRGWIDRRALWGVD